MSKIRIILQGKSVASQAGKVRGGVMGSLQSKTKQKQVNSKQNVYESIHEDT